MKRTWHLTAALSHCWGSRAAGDKDSLDVPTCHGRRWCPSARLVPREPPAPVAAPAQDAAHPAETRTHTPPRGLRSLVRPVPPGAWAEPDPRGTSAPTAAPKGPRWPLQRGNAPVPGNFVFIMNKCLPAPPGRVGKWMEGNSGREGVSTTLHPGQHVLSTSEGGHSS